MPRLKPPISARHRLVLGHVFFHPNEKPPEEAAKEVKSLQLTGAFEAACQAGVLQGPVTAAQKLLREASPNLKWHENLYLNPHYETNIAAYYRAYRKKRKRAMAQVLRKEFMQQ